MKLLMWYHLIIITMQYIITFLLSIIIIVTAIKKYKCVIVQFIFNFIVLLNLFSFDVSISWQFVLYVFFSRLTYIYTILHVSSYLAEMMLEWIMEMWWPLVQHTDQVSTDMIHVTVSMLVLMATLSKTSETISFEEFQSICTWCDGETAFLYVLLLVVSESGHGKGAGK